MLSFKKMGLCFIIYLIFLTVYSLTDKIILKTKHQNYTLMNKEKNSTWGTMTNFVRTWANQCSNHWLPMLLQLWQKHKQNLSLLKWDCQFIYTNIWNSLGGVNRFVSKIWRRLFSSWCFKKLFKDQQWCNSLTMHL